MTTYREHRPRIAVTGPEGFVGWHTRCAARSRWGGDLVRLGRPEFASEDSLAAALQDADAVIHLAGINRATSDDVVVRGNLASARRLVEGLDRVDRPIAVVYGNSIHSQGDSAFGRAKREAAEILAEWGRRRGAVVADVMMPNLFGEHGRPFYNSVVATFAHQLARGETPHLVDDKPLPLLHVQRMADVLLDLAASPIDGRHAVPATEMLVSDVLAALTSFSRDYRQGVLPDLSDPMTRDLFNTYRAATFPAHFPIHPPVRADARGELVEAVKGVGGEAQVFYSTTRPGITRGQHYHRRKVERFLVINGRGEMRLRRLFSHEVVSFPVCGERPAIVDMPTLWVHSITNVGDGDLVTLFYADEIYDPAQPDTFPETV